MTKTELRQSFVALGWEVQPVVQWVKVSEVQGKSKYDVNAVSPEDAFGTAQVVVVDDSGAGESATAAGFWVAPSTTFDEDTRAYATGLEGGNVFSVSVTDVNSADKVALATAYMSDGSVNNYVIKRRADTFSYQLLL